MKSISVSRSFELQLVLDVGRGELVRAFVREASLSDGVPLSAASLIADDIGHVWQALCPSASDRERVRIVVLCASQEVRTQIFLHGHSRFSNIAESLARCNQLNAGISWREHGVDGWEISIHRNLTDNGESPALFSAEEPPSAAKVAAAADYVIDVPHKTDAAAIARCFLEVYGRSYVHPEVFSPRRYWHEVESGQLIPVVARDGRGEVVGHVALECGPGTQVAERGEAVVLSAHRGHGLLERMTERLAAEALKHELQGVYAEPLTIHTFSQRNDERAGMPICAVLLGANPENFRPKDLACPTAGQRQSYLRTFRFVRQPAPRAIHAPAPYREILGKLYEWLGVTTSVAPAGPAATASRTAIKVNGRGYGQISFERIGPNAAIELAQALRDLQALGAISIQLSGAMSDPGLHLLTDSARALGFFFCGLGPAFADGSDTFLLQLLSEPLDTKKLQLFTKETQELVAFIDVDRISVAPNI